MPSVRSTNIGAIVGGTVGGVAFVIILGLAAFWYLRKRADRWRGPFEIEDASDKPVPQTGVEPFTLGAPTPAQPSAFLASSGSEYSASSMPAALLLSDDNVHTGEGHVLPPSYEEASSSGSPVTSRPPTRDHKLHRIPVPSIPATVSEMATSPTDTEPGEAL